MNKEKIYEKLNELNINTEFYKKLDVDQTEKDELFNTLKKQIRTEKESTPKFEPSILVFAVIFLLFLGSQTPLGEKVQATASSIIENIRYSLNQALGNEQTSSADTALSFNQTARIGDAKISIQEMIAFDHRIVFNVLIDLEGPADEQKFTGFSDFEIRVNGKSLDTQGLSGLIEEFDVEENIDSVIYSTEVTEDSLLEDEMTIEMIIENIHYYNPSAMDQSFSVETPIIEGDTHFSVSTTMEELTEHTQVYEANHFVNTGEYDYLIERLYVHPLLNFIEITSENWGDENFQLIELRGTDNEGRSVVFEHTLNLNTQEYRRNSFTLSERKSEITSEELTEVEFLDLQFYSAGWPEGGTAEFIAYGDSFRIEMSKDE